MGACCTTESEAPDRTNIVDANDDPKLTTAGTSNEGEKKNDNTDKSRTPPKEELLKRAEIIHDLMDALGLLDGDANQLPSYGEIYGSENPKDKPSTSSKDPTDKRVGSQVLHESIMEGLTSDVLAIVLESVRALKKENEDLRERLSNSKGLAELIPEEPESRSEEEKDMSERLRSREDLERVIRAKHLASSQSDVIMGDRRDQFQIELEARKRLDNEIRELEKKKLQLQNEIGSLRSVYLSMKSEDEGDEIEASNDVDINQSESLIVEDTERTAKIEHVQNEEQTTPKDLIQTSKSKFLETCLEGSKTLHSFDLLSDLNPSHGNQAEADETIVEEATDEILAENLDNHVEVKSSSSGNLDNQEEKKNPTVLKSQYL